VDGHLLELIPKEYGVLRLLLGAGGAPVPHDEVVRTVWDEHLDPQTSAVRATVSRLRAKLGDPGLIAADKGEGYRLCE
jgi:DNA-binding response OmpR family regulator